MQTIKKIVDFLLKLDRLYLLRKFKKEPIFIGGCARSGTTLLLSILDAHSKIFAIDHEANLFISKSSLKNDFIRAIRIKYILIQNIKKKNAHRWCEKTPKNVTKIDQIDKYFKGRFKFIHIIRDGRDVVTSRHPSNPQEYWVSIDRWVNDVKLGLLQKNNPNVLIVKYEDIILDFENTLHKVLSFLNEDTEANIFEYFKHTNIRKDIAWFNEVKEISNKSLKKWTKIEHEDIIRKFNNNDEALALLEELKYTD